MTYIVTDACIKCKYTDCVDVCPVDCFYEGENMLVIPPDELIYCGVGEPECPPEAIRPDTVAMPHHYGEYVRHPWVEGDGPSPNTPFFTGEGYVSNTADQTFLVKVRVEKA